MQDHTATATIDELRKVVLRTFNNWLNQLKVDAQERLGVGLEEFEHLNLWQLFSDGIHPRIVVDDLFMTDDDFVAAFVVDEDGSSL
jgi:hypothetical protein